MLLAYGELLDLNCFIKFVLMMMVPILVFLVWKENKEANSNKVNQLSMVVESNSIEIDQMFEQDLEMMKRNGDSMAYCSCSFCGKLSHITITCSRCKAAFYCSKVCHVTHWRFWHKFECLESEADQDQEGSSPSYGAHLLLDPERETEEGVVPYIKPKEAVECTNGTSKFHQLANVNCYHHRCAVCGNPSTKKCSRCKVIKYCSKTCQHFDWRSGHQFHCVVEKKSLAQALIAHQGVSAYENVVVPTNSYTVEDHNIEPLCLEFQPEGDGNAKAIVLRSEEAIRENHMDIEEQEVRNLKEELEMIKNKNISLQSERDKWKRQTSYAIKRLYNLRKENEHQMFVLKNENELISNAENQARIMIHSLSQRLHCLQIEMETTVAERKKQEEYMHKLQNECAKAKTELQEQNKCVQRLTMELEEATQFPIRIAEETTQKFTNDLSSVSAAESRTPVTVQELPTITLTRNLSYTRQVCALCLTNEKDMAFGCGHMLCRECGLKIRKCHICRKKITNRIRLYPG